MKPINDNENQYWDGIADEYADEIMSIQPIFFRNSGRLINSELVAGQSVADIGNGGVINYRFDGLKQLDCIDLSLSRTAEKKYEKNKNISFKVGNVFLLSNIPDEQYDRVIIQCVIHHLAGPNYSVTVSNTQKALSECMRILKKDGELLIVESTVLPWFEKIEKLLYGLMQLFFKIIRFDTVYQYSAPSLVQLINAMKIGTIKSSEMIEIGKYMWLLKRKFPNKLTPCRAVWLCIKK
jgi:ubiquinone/menaquinone biosynthesis C-methylase UbiE